MRLVSYRTAQGDGYGWVEADRIHPLHATPGAAATLADWLASGATAQPAAQTLPFASVELLPPIPAPGKIFCVATNFHEPARADQPAPDYPLVFTRFGDSLVGHGAELRLPQDTEKFDYEGEVAVIIGRPGFRIPRERAMSHVAGYACFNDASARDWQRHSTQFTPGKNFWRSGSFGPWLVSADDVPNPAALRLETRVNGVKKQAVSLADFIFDIPWLIAYLSSFSPLAPGDVIATGTPSGFGATRRPPEFLRPGDTVEVEVSGLGLLRNRVSAPE